MCYYSPSWTVNLLRGSLTTFTTCTDYYDKKKKKNVETFQKLQSTSKRKVFLFFWLRASPSAPTVASWDYSTHSSSLPLAPLAWLLPNLLPLEPHSVPLVSGPCSRLPRLASEEFGPWCPPVRDAADYWTSSREVQLPSPSNSNVHVLLASLGTYPPFITLQVGSSQLACQEAWEIASIYKSRVDLITKEKRNYRTWGFIGELKYIKIDVAQPLPFMNKETENQRGHPAS